MELTITVQEGTARRIALTRAMAAFNRSGNPPITELELLQKTVDGQLDNLVAAYVKTTMSKLEFLDRFTVEERVAIRAAAQSNAAIEDYLQMLNVSDEVDLTHALTVAGVQSLEAGGLIATGRAGEILGL